MIKKLSLLLAFLLLCGTVHAAWKHNPYTRRRDYYESDTTGGWTDGDPNPYVTDTTDSVGIGTVAPAYKLDVLGTVGIGSVTPADTMYIGSGNVGIGTTGPAYRLDVLGTVGIGTVTAGDQLSISTYVGIGTSCGLRDNGNDFEFTENSGGSWTDIGSGGTSEWTDLGTEIHPTEVTDNVGIGTIAPTHRLEVLGATGVGIGTSSAGDALIISSSGNVGIGSSAPLGTLGVHGTIVVTDAVEQADGAIISGIKHGAWLFDPDAVCDGNEDRVFLFTVNEPSAWAPNGVIIDGWALSFGADPTTEADIDLVRAAAYIGVAGATVMDICDTTAGVSTENTDANINAGATVGIGTCVYLEFGTAYTATAEKMIFEMDFHCVD